MTDGHRPDDHRRPASEPEIIPPGRGDPRAGRNPSASRVRIFVDAGGTHQVRVVRLGPFGVFLVGLLIAVLAGLILLLLLGVLLIWIPLVALFVAVAIGAALVRGWFRQRQ